MATTAESRIQSIQRIFDSWADCLGTSERNIEIKVILPMLCELSWEPTRDISWCFQIDRFTCKPPAEASLAADLALRDDIGLCAVGEIKYWDAGQKEKDWAKAVAQARQYQLALAAPRAFISCGWRWTILDEHGNLADEFKEMNVELLLKKLKPFLARGLITNQVRDHSVWKFGVRPSDPTLRARKLTRAA